MNEPVNVDDVTKDIEKILDERIRLLKADLFSELEASMVAQKKLEEGAAKEEDREFFRGTHVGIMDAYIAIGKRLNSKKNLIG